MKQTLSDRLESMVQAEPIPEEPVEAPVEEETTDYYEDDAHVPEDEETFEPSFESIESESLSPEMKTMYDSIKSEREELDEEKRYMRRHFHGAGHQENDMARKAQEYDAIMQDPVKNAAVNSNFDPIAALPENVREEIEKEGNDYKQAVGAMAMSEILKNPQFSSLINDIKVLKSNATQTRKVQLEGEVDSLIKAVGEKGLTQKVQAEMMDILSLPRYQARPIAEVYEMVTGKKVSNRFAKKVKAPPQVKRGSLASQRTTEAPTKAKTGNLREAVRRAFSRPS
mgnify:FL=1